MNDVAPALHEVIEKDFRERIGKDSQFQTLYRRVKQAGATHADAAMLAERAGQIGADVLRTHLTEDALPDGRLYYNIAQRTIAPALEDVHEVADAACIRVQNQLNRAAGIGIKAQSVPVDEDRIHGIVSAAADATDLDAAHRHLEETIPTYARHVADESVRRNADFQYHSGLSPKIIRKATGNVCPWCAALAGTYDYADVSDTGNDVFRRHANCRCTVEFDPGGGKRQNVHTKRWTPDIGRDKIEARKAIEAPLVHRVFKNSDLPNGLPITSSPNSISDKTDDRGNVLQRRIYDGAGRASVDYDTSNHGDTVSHPTGAHKHVFNYDKRNPHGKPLPLTETDLEQNQDIIQRGVNYHDEK